MSSLFLATLAQIPETARSAGAPALSEEPSSILQLGLGFLFVVIVLLVAFKVAGRNRVQE